MVKYTVHEPGSNLKVREYKTLGPAFRFAYSYLPLDVPGKYNPEGKYVTVQEWDENVNPLRQWMITGRRS